MLYVINDKHYIKVGRKFILVDIEYKNNDIVLKPNRTNFIEDNGKVKYKTQVVDDKFKQKFKPAPTPRYTSHRD